MRCPRCGKENRESRAACQSCGYPLQESEAPASSEVSRPVAVSTVRCSNCGSHVRDGARFCTNCGQLEDGNMECPECRSRVGASDHYCPGCGRALRPPRAPRSLGKPVGALVLGVVPGLLSLWGIGHLFAGRINRGLVFLVLGLVMTVVAPTTILLLVRDLGGRAILYVLGAVVWVVLWLYQSIDAYYAAGGE